jgi:lantibiotic biosynthesis protein
MTRPSSLVSAAATIGKSLCTSAYWHDGRCNWVGRSPREAPDPSLPLTPTVAALGPELYGGTAGIALFLAQLHARVGGEDVRATSLGAIRHAVWKIADVPAAASYSFYSGAIGIAYAAACLGLLLHRPDLIDDGLALARRAVASDADQPLLDVVGGRAGAIAPLLWLATLPDGSALEAAAIRYAEQLAAAAITDDNVWRWDNERAAGAKIGGVPLCGFAHGSSGMGLALIECGVHCGRRDWIEGGLAAFRYEDRLFDADRHNWPDLREYGPRPGDGASPRASFMVAWCHGAAGIGLARLRALRLLPRRKKELAVGVRRALSATAATFKATPEYADASPCHGRAGLAETLLYATEILGDRRYAAQASKRWTASVRARPADASWPCGVASGRNNPSLMLGYAGIGYALLRADRPRQTPSLLVIDSARYVPATFPHR